MSGDAHRLHDSAQHVPGRHRRGRDHAGDSDSHACSTAAISEAAWSPAVSSRAFEEWVIHDLTFAATKPKLGSMDYRKLITIEPGKRGGQPCIRGMRITVYEVLDYLASGMTEAEILADFPDLTAEDIKACLAFAADRERKLIAIPS